MTDAICPCLSGKSFADCCQPLLQGAVARTPEALMRSRYTAYTCLDINYIEKTMRPPASRDFDYEATRDWANSVLWLGLQVLETKLQMSGTRGVVEFVASYEENGVKEQMHCRSIFKKHIARWYYVNERPVQCTV